MGGVSARPFASRFLLLLSQFDGSLFFSTLETESTLVTPGLPLMDDDGEEEMSNRRHTASKQLLLPLAQFSIIFTGIIYELLYYSRQGTWVQSEERVASQAVEQYSTTSLPVASDRID